MGREGNSINFSGKLEFIIGFIAILITLYQFRTSLDLIQINIIIGSFSLTNVIIGFSLLLFISFYLYAINYIRYDFPSLTDIEKLRYIEFFAHLLYFFALVAYPLIIFFLAGISYIISLFIQMPLSSSVELLIFGITSIVMSILSIILQTIEFKRREQMKMEGLDEIEKQFAINAKEAYEKGIYEPVFLYLYNSVVKLIQIRLVKKLGIDIERVPTWQLIEIAYKNNLITTEDAELIKDIRGIRNKVAHGEKTIKITKDMTKNFIDKTEKILRKLNYVPPTDMRLFKENQ
jgi:hypothetical protein